MKYLIVDTELLKLLERELVMCKLCQGHVNIHEVDNKHGFANYHLSVSLIAASGQTPKKGRPPFNVKLQLVISFRDIGKALSAMKKY